MADLIIILGTAGSGKTTIGKYLQEKFDYPLINYGELRQENGDLSWETYSVGENKAYDELLQALDNLWKQGKKNIVVDDLPIQGRYTEILGRFEDKNVKVIKLIVNNDDVLKQRVMDEKRQFRDFEKAKRWNEMIKTMPTLNNEKVIDNTEVDLEETINQIMEFVK